LTINFFIRKKRKYRDLSFGLCPVKKISRLSEKLIPRLKVWLHFDKICIFQIFGSHSGMGKKEGGSGILVRLSGGLLVNSVQFLK
jgi:hypothetical protein